MALQFTAPALDAMPEWRRSGPTTPLNKKNTTTRALLPDSARTNSACTLADRT
ncbi:hypothetical protein J6590_101298 [Homalodisca vitripennis]|nr:hypothetical protein J6590_101298 [Homalodisca vitripennis]